MAKLFNFRCPDDLMELIEQRASEAGEDKSRIVIDSLRYALNITDLPSDAIVGRSKILELIARVEKLEKKAEGDYRATDERLSEIEQRDRQIAEMQQKLDLLSAKLATSQEKPRTDASIERGQLNLTTENFSDALSEKSVEAGSIVQPPKSAPVKSGRVKPLNYGAIPPNAYEGLNQTELCEFYGLSWRNLKRNCDSAGFSDVIDYLAAMTGIQWEPCEAVGRSKRYAPIEVTRA